MWEIAPRRKRNRKTEQMGTSTVFVGRPPRMADWPCFEGMMQIEVGRCGQCID